MDRGVSSSGSVILGEGGDFSREPWSNVSAHGTEPLIGMKLYDEESLENSILRLYPEENARVVVGIRPSSCRSGRDCVEHKALP